MQRGLRGELTIDFNNYGGEGMELYFPDMHCKRTRSWSTSWRKGNSNQDIRKKKEITVRVASTGTGCPESTRKGPKQPH